MDNTVHLVGPLVLDPVWSERVWGETSLEPWFPVSGLETPVGEAWLTARECRIAAGSLAGETLAEATEKFPELLGDEAAGGFPLLVKILFPREKLSVQVHPNDAQALAAGKPNGQGKTECWYVLSAEPGAAVALGFKEAMSLEEVRAAIADGTLEEKLAHVPVKAGDMVFVEAGTVHAIGPGVVILETQQYSDVTYRLFDYGRPRELHLDEGLAVSRVTTGAKPVKPVAKGAGEELARSNYFVVDRFEMEAGLRVELGCEDELQILIALGEGCSLVGPDGSAMRLPKAYAVVIPGEGEGYALTGAGRLEVVRITC
jgi:mannose-6-phosphate isomerase